MGLSGLSGIIGGGGSGVKNFKSYGGTGDARSFQDGSVTSGSTTLTSASGAAFTSADTGKTVCISYGNVSLMDFCNGTNGTALDSHVPDYRRNGWAANQGTADIQSNTIRMHTSGSSIPYLGQGTCLQTNNSGFTNQDIYAQFEINTTGCFPGLVVKFTDINNYVLVQCEQDLGTLTMYQIVSGLLFVVSTTSGITFAQSVWHTLDVNTSGTTVTGNLTLANGTTASVTGTVNAGLTGTNIGLWASNVPDHVFFRNVRVMPQGATNLNLVTTATYSSATTVTLATAPKSTGSSRFCAIGTSNNTPLTNALAALPSTTGGILFVPDGIYLFSGDSFGLHQNSAMVGSNLGPTSHSLNASGGSGAPSATISGLNPNNFGGGTIFYLTNSSTTPGPSITTTTYNGNAFLRMNGGSSQISGICFFSAMQAQSDVVPQANGPVIDASYAGGVGSTFNNTIENVEFLACNTGIYGNAAQRMTCRGITGQPLYVGIFSLNTYDCVRLEDIHLNPWWAYQTNAYTWQNNNGTGVYLAHNDGLQANNWLILGYANDLTLTKYDDSSGNGNYGTWGNFSNIQLDQSAGPLNITWIGPTSAVQFTNLMAYTSANGGNCAIFNGSVGADSMCNFTNCFFSGGFNQVYSGIAYVASGDCNITVTGCEFYNINGQGILSTTGGRWAVYGNHFRSTGVPPVNFSGSANATYVANRGTGTANSNTGSGTITAAGNVT